MTSRMFSRPKTIDVSRSTPMARPPWGGVPYLNALMKKPNFCSICSGVKPKSLKILDWILGS